MTIPLRTIVLGAATVMAAFAAAPSLAEVAPARLLVFEAGIGGGATRLFPDAAGEGVAGGETMRFGVAVRVQPWLRLGVEMSGMLREGGSADSTGAHRDLFLVDQGIVASVLPLGATQGIAGPRLRAGIGRGSAKTQVTIANQRNDETRTGTGFMVGAGYLMAVGGQLSIGLDVTWRRLVITSGPLDHVTLLGSTFAVQLHFP